MQRDRHLPTVCCACSPTLCCRHHCMPAFPSKRDCSLSRRSFTLAWNSSGQPRVHVAPPVVVCSDTATLELVPVPRRRTSRLRPCEPSSCTRPRYQSDRFRTIFMPPDRTRRRLFQYREPKRSRLGPYASSTSEILPTVVVRSVRHAHVLVHAAGEEGCDSLIGAPAGGGC